MMCRSGGTSQDDVPRLDGLPPLGDHTGCSDKGPYRMAEDGGG